jgi:hypothetical protein
VIVSEWPRCTVLCATAQFASEPAPIEVVVLLVPQRWVGFTVAVTAVFDGSS